MTFKDRSSGRLTDGRSSWKYDSQSTTEHRVTASDGRPVATSWVVAVLRQYRTVLVVPLPASALRFPQSGVTQSQPICSAKIQLAR